MYAWLGQDYKNTNFIMRNSTTKEMIFARTSPTIHNDLSEDFEFIKKNKDKIDQINKLISALAGIKLNKKEPLKSINKAFKIFTKGMYTLSQWDSINAIARKMIQMGIGLPAFKELQGLIGDNDPVVRKFISEQENTQKLSHEEKDVFRKALMKFKDLKFLKHENHSPGTVREDKNVALLSVQHMKTEIDYNISLSLEPNTVKHGHDYEIYLIDKQGKRKGIVSGFVTNRDNLDILRAELKRFENRIWNKL